MLRDKEAVSILFDDVAHRFVDRPGGYTRIIQLANVRLGDAGKQAILEFVGENDRVKKKTSASKPVIEDDEPQTEEEQPEVEEEAKADAGDEAATGDEVAEKTEADSDATADEAKEE
jgi:large subunit ribosomal protein L17